MKDLSQYTVQGIYHDYEGDTPYGLKLRIDFSGDACLFFDSNRFYFSERRTMLEKDGWKKWEQGQWAPGVSVTAIREDELTAYFILFSDGSILHIYQRVQDLQSWEQDFELVHEKDGKHYREVKLHMQEDWVEDCPVAPLPEG